MKISNFVLVCLLTFIFLGLIGRFLVPARGIYGSSECFYEVTGLPFDVYACDVDSEGRIFCCSDEQDMWRSTDGGKAWTKVHEASGAGYSLMGVFVDSRDYIFYAVYAGGIDLWRSTDHGGSWTEVAPNQGMLWHWGETSNGTLLINYYSDNNPYIIRSDDAGASWYVWFNMTEEGYDSKHLHAVRVNPYNDDIWIASGDGAGKSHVLRSTDWTTWEEVATLQPTDFIFDDTYVYLVPDASAVMYRVTHRGSFESEYVWFAGMSGDDSGNFGYWGNKIQNEDILLFGSVHGQLWGSWDGEHWVKIFEAAENHINHISTRRPIFFVDFSARKLYRLTMTSDDIKALYNEKFRDVRGGIHSIGSSTTVIEQMIPSGTSYLDLEEVVISNPQAAIKGYSRYDLLENSGWEWGNYTGWNGRGSHKGFGLTTSEKYEGSYSCYVKKQTIEPHDWIWEQLHLTANKGDIIVASGYVKTNTTIPAGNLTFAIEIYSSNKSAYLVSQMFFANTSWKRFSVSAKSEYDNHDYRVMYSFRKTTTVNFTIYFDAALVEIKQEHVGNCAFDQTEEQDAYQYFNATNPFAYPSPYFNTEVKTLNPTLTINGQAVSYNGTLNNGTSSSATSLSALSGIITITSNTEGSRLCTLRITGTTHTKVTNAHILNFHNSIPFGVYYETPNIASPFFVILVDKNSDIVPNTQRWSPASARLKFQVNAPIGYSGTVKVYCADCGSPIGISGATSWNYSSTSKICTMTVTYSSTPEIEIKYTQSSVGGGGGGMNKNKLK